METNILSRSGESTCLLEKNSALHIVWQLFFRRHLPGLESLYPMCNPDIVLNTVESYCMYGDQGLYWSLWQRL